MLDIDEVCNRLRVSRSTMQKWISKKIHCGPFFKRIGRTPMMTEADFDRYIESVPNIGGPEDEK